MNDELESLRGQVKALSEVLTAVIQSAGSDFCAEAHGRLQVALDVEAEEAQIEQRSQSYESARIQISDAYLQLLHALSQR